MKIINVKSFVDSGSSIKQEEKQKYGVESIPLHILINDKANLEKLISITPEKYHAQINVYDDLDLAIACHWGPCAFGYLFVCKK